MLYEAIFFYTLNSIWVCIYSIPHLSFIIVTQHCSTIGLEYTGEENIFIFFTYISKVQANYGNRHSEWRIARLSWMNILATKWHLLKETDAMLKEQAVQKLFK
jgi:hypothetical protein